MGIHHKSHHMFHSTQDNHNQLYTHSLLCMNNNLMDQLDCMFHKGRHIPPYIAMMCLRNILAHKLYNLSYYMTSSCLKTQHMESRALNYSNRNQSHKPSTMILMMLNISGSWGSMVHIDHQYSQRIQAYNMYIQLMCLSDCRGGNCFHKYPHIHHWLSSSHMDMIHI